MKPETYQALVPGISVSLLGPQGPKGPSYEEAIRA